MVTTFTGVGLENDKRTVFANVAAGEGISRAGDGAGAGFLNALQKAVDNGLNVLAGNENIHFSTFRFARIIAAGTGRAAVEGFLQPGEDAAATGR